MKNFIRPLHNRHCKTAVSCANQDRRDVLSAFDERAISRFPGFTGTLGNEVGVYGLLTSQTVAVLAHQDVLEGKLGHAVWRIL